MPSDPPEPNTLLPLGAVRSTQPGDLPDHLRRRYFVEDRGREWRLFVDAQSKVAAIEDRGRRLLSQRSDPNAVRDMVRIAEHRGWRAVDVRGARSFRREAWLAGRSAGLEVRGYRPTERDLQDLQRRLDARDRTPAHETTAPSRRPGPARDGILDRLRVVETVVRARVADQAQQARLLSNARQRIADWLERGARFDPVRAAPDAARGHELKERRRVR
jgi:hypothetical protein